MYLYRDRVPNIDVLSLMHTRRFAVISGLHAVTSTIGFADEVTLCKRTACCARAAHFLSSGGYEGTRAEQPPIATTPHLISTIRYQELKTLRVHGDTISIALPSYEASATFQRTAVCQAVAFEV